MKILVAMSSPEYLRFYDDTLVELARRGHEVVLAAGMIREGKPVRFDHITAADARITAAGLVPERGDGWTTLARAVRGTMDFVRYLHPELADATLLRARVARQALPLGLQWCDRIRARPAAVVDRWMRRLERVERAIPPAAALLRFLDAQAPDLVLVSPLVEPASDQVDLVRAAQARGIRVAALVASWDNLTNKGDLKAKTGLVAVWNEAQRREAIDLHRVAPECVAVTGAQPFDRWFDRQPSRPRAAFCREVGLPDDRPFVLFTGSSIFIARAEVEMPFVRQWVDAIRASADPAVRDLGILIRPHPYNGRAWTPELFDGLDGVAVWPRGGYDPVDEASRAGLFDSLVHCDAVVGINTSAMIEAAIVGRPVFSIETPQFAGTQDGTRHYQYLLPENGGFLHVASSFEAHLAQLSAMRRDPASERAALAGFVGRFIRPQGLGRPSMPVLVEALETFGRSPAPEPVRTSAADRLYRLALWPLRWGGRWVQAPVQGKRRKGPRKDDAARDAGRPPARRAAGGPSVAAAVAVLGPVLAGLAVVVAFVASELAGTTPFAYPRPVNAAEAAGTASSSEALRYFWEGQSPVDVVEVGPHVISASVRRVTPAEAAVWSRRLRLIQLVDGQGGIPDAATRRHLACLARDIRAEEVAGHLDPDDAVVCEPGAAAAAVEARR